MHTQNVNTAASDSPKTWENTPETIYFTRKIAALTDLAQSEGEMLFYRALARLGIAPADVDAEIEAPAIALDKIGRLDVMGAITSLQVYAMVRDIDALSRAITPERLPGMLPSFETMQAEAIETKAQYLAEIAACMSPVSHAHQNRM